MALAEKSRSRPLIRNACELLYKLYDQQGFPDSANHFFRRYSALRDSIANNQLKAKTVAARFELELELLKKEKELQQERLQQTKFEKAVLVGGLILSFIIGTIVVRNYRLKQKNDRVQSEKLLGDL